MKSEYEEKNLMSFAGKLKIARINAGLTQQGLATLAGCKQFDITRYENAKIFPQNEEILTRIAEVLKVDPYYLRYSGGESHVIKKTKYGREITINHISRDYTSRYEERSFYESAKDSHLKSDRAFIHYVKENCTYLTEDDRSVLYDVINLLVLDNVRGIECSTH